MSYPPPRLRIISRASTTLLKLQLTTAPAKQYHVSPNDHSCRKSRECEYAFLPLRLFRRFNGINQILGWQVSYSSVDGEFFGSRTWSQLDAGWILQFWIEKNEAGMPAFSKTAIVLKTPPNLSYTSTIIIYLSQDGVIGNRRKEHPDCVRTSVQDVGAEKGRITQTDLVLIAVHVFTAV